jgi:PAS domain S-box-containing protein
MLVEDEHLLRERLGRILQRQITDVLTCADAHEALGKIDAFAPDLIITDIRMPGMSGLEMIAKIRETRPDLPVVITSAFSQSDLFIEAIKLKVENFVIKPVDVDVLLESIRKVAEHRQMRQELEAQRLQLQHYQYIIDAAPISIVITDASGVIEYVNRCFETLSGYTLDEARGENASILKSGHTSSAQYAQLWRTIKQGEVWSGIFKNLKKDRTPYWERAFIAPIFDDSGTIVNYLGVKEEINEEMRLREALEDKEQIMIAQSRQAAMGEMISMIAHQWRQPLNIISLAVSNIETTRALHLLDEKTLETNTGIIAKNIFYMSNTIDAFRNFFKPEDAKELVGIEEILNCIVEMIGQSLKNENISLKIENNSHTPLLIYKSSLIQVLLNILSNAKDEFLAKKVTPAFITVTINETKEAVTIAICDNAGGISPSIIDKLGQPYFTTKKLTGTGLGLHISRTIVEKYLLGTLSWHNDKDGACFVITLNAQKNGVNKTGSVKLSIPNE